MLAQPNARWRCDNRVKESKAFELTPEDRIFLGQLVRKLLESTRR